MYFGKTHIVEMKS